MPMVGKRAIPVVGAYLWNDLPLELESAPSPTLQRVDF